MTVLGLGGFAATARADVVLNEVNCEGTDWVEFVNTSSGAADLSGWLLTDDPLDRDPPRADHRMSFAAGAQIGPLASLVVQKGAGGFPFGVGCGDDTIRLADAGGGLVDEIALGQASVPGDTWGRYPNATGPWMQTEPTQGGPNQPSTSAGPPPDPAWLYDPGAVVEIDLSAPQSSLDALEADPSTYVDASFSLSTAGGSYGPLQVGLRLKGGLAPSRPLSAKAAFKLKFSHSVAGQRFLGLKKLTLNNMVWDPSMVHELLAYEVYRAAGVAAPRTGYAYVRLNGQDYGVYLNVEAPDDVFLERWHESTGHLYEGQYGNDVVPGGAAAFELDEGAEDDRSDLEALVAAANSTSGDWSDQLAEEADLAQMTTMWAVEKYVGHADGYSSGPPPNNPNNYFLHSDASGRFTMVPWGADYTWTVRPGFDEGGGVLFRLCLADPSCADMYRQALASLPGLIAPLELDALAVRTAGLLEPWQQIDPRVEQTEEEIAAGLAATRAYLAGRPAEVDAFLNPRPPQSAPETVVERPQHRARKRVNRSKSKRKKNRQRR